MIFRMIYKVVLKQSSLYNHYHDGIHAKGELRFIMVFKFSDFFFLA